MANGILRAKLNMTLTILHYGILVIWLLGVILWSSRNFSWNARGKAKSYLAYSFAAVSFLAVAMFALDIAKGNDYLNLVAFSIVSHLVVLIMYYFIFPSRQHVRKGGIYGSVGMSLFLGSTAGVVLSIEVVKLLLGSGGG